MAVSVRLSELTQISQAELTNSDLFLVTDSESTSSKKLTLSDFKSHLFSGNSFAEFSDVDLSSPAPSDGQFLRYDAGIQKWKAGDISLSSLGELNDVDLTGTPPSAGQTLIWNGVGNKFEPGTIDLTPLQTQITTVDNSLSAVDTRLQTAETSVSNLEVAMAPETLNSINELAAALGDDPDAFSTLQTSHTSLGTRVTTIEGNIATQTELDSAIAALQSDVDQNEADADSAIAALQTTVDNLDIGLAPDTLDTINELAAALGDNPDAISTIQNTLNKLVPPAPTTLDGLAVNVLTDGGTQRLCVGFTDRTGGTSGYSAGDQLKRNTDSSITTDKIQDVGPGDSGSLVGIISDTLSTSTTLTSSINSASVNGLELSDNKDASLSTRDSGIQADFYQVYDVRFVNAAVSGAGLNEVYFQHSGNTSAKGYFYEDSSLVSAPVLTTSSLYLPSSQDVSYSSGVPHYTNSTDNEFSYSLFATNLSGDMYINNTIATSSQTSGFTHQGNKTYVDFGGTNPPAKDFGVGSSKTASVIQYPRDLHVQVTNNQLSNWSMSTPYGSDSVRPSASLTFNIMGSTARTNVVDEDNILIGSVGSGTGNATRVGDGTGDNPSPNPQTWVSSSTPTNHEAIVVGGVLKHDVTDYSTGHRPVGPDLSSRTVNAQYAEFDIRRSGVSQFTINYTGSCSGCWVTMPTNTTWQNSLSGTNGWADMFQSYRGSGVPTSTEPGSSSGGVMDNNGGSFTCVFGTESSSNDSENRILVRWKLSSGQSITSMSFSA
tara:strand:- start:118 stop:2433 length:2316 start_codon:yes stop_codon:yes gene_type:complete